MKTKKETLIHTFPPVHDGNSRILILGSFPSVKSRENGFYYGHPQNRFWKVLSSLFGCPCPGTNEEKRQFLLSRHVALYDAAHSCTIEGSSDATLKNVKANDFTPVFDVSPIRAVFCNGRKSFELVNRLSDIPEREIPLFLLPSTSPANASFSLMDLTEEWKIILEYLS